MWKEEWEEDEEEWEEWENTRNDTVTDNIRDMQYLPSIFLFFALLRLFYKRGVREGEGEREEWREIHRKLDAR